MSDEQYGSHGGGGPSAALTQNPSAPGHARQ